MLGFASVDPATGRKLAEWPSADEAALETALAGGAARFRRWSRRPAAERADGLRAIAASLREASQHAALEMASEVGKPLAQGRAEVEKCAATLEYFADFAPSRLVRETEGGLVRLEPLGPVLAIMPWNYPLWQVIRAAAGAWSVGDVLTVKPAPRTVGCTRVLVDAVAAAGCPEALSMVLAEVDQIPRLLADSRIAAATFTGSSAAGRSVAEAAGRSLKKVVLELGGSDAFVVFADANVARAAAIGAESRLQNAGQSCIAAKRFIVVRSVAQAFVDALCGEFRSRIVGDPMDPAATVGPMARDDLREQLHSQVRRSINGGARVLLGGSVPPPPGWYYPPTVLVDVTPDHPVWTEETFGPVAAVRVVDSEEEAIEAANDTQFGLGVSLHGGDQQRLAALAGRFRAGGVFVDGLVRSDARFPFGGVGISGFGRELGEIGLAELANVQTVRIG
jgi:succinate-semialdehyde dehydrogenase/glutarate-semialdehyde dehydrogenase